MNDTTVRAYTGAIAGGAILWFVTSALTGRAEAWDSSLYWLAAYPLAIVLAGALGFWAPERPWRWGLAVMLAQAFALAVASTSFGLLPLGLAMFAILALPAIGLAKLMAVVRLRMQRA